MTSTRRDLIIGGTCCAGAILAGLMSSRNAPHVLPPGGLDRLIPKQIAPWALTGTDGVVLAEGSDDPRGPYDDLSTRIYQADRLPPVTLLVAYVGSQRGDVRLHRPEACYPAAGFALSNAAPVRLTFAGARVVSAQMILATSAVRDEWLLYWTRIGAEFPTTNVAQLEASVRANLAGGVPDGVLVRLSVPGRDRGLAFATFRRFLSTMTARRPDLLEILCGPPRRA